MKCLEILIYVIYSAAIIESLYAVYQFAIRSNILGVLVASAIMITALVVFVLYLRSRRIDGARSSHRDRN